MPGKGHLGEALLGLLTKSLGTGFPRGVRGKTLLTAADFSGTHSGSLFTSYAFLTIDFDRNGNWFSAQQSFRRQELRNRRMSYKALNDSARRRALSTFLSMSDQLVGALTIVVVPRDFGPLVCKAEGTSDAVLDLWKPGVREHLLRVSHLGGMVTAHFSSPGQDVFFITDQDEIASNAAQLSRLTEIMSRMIGHSSPHGFGHLRVGTTKDDDGSLMLEDLAAIADLSAGAVCDIMGSMAADDVTPRHRIITPLPEKVAAKSRLIGRWLSKRENSLRRAIILLRSGPDDGGDLVLSVALHSGRENIIMLGEQPVP
ncbi:hypothetical protein [Novosphingobium sp. CECT 9465]|uniref:hypothetical protein n=1 Tax=Novosphingobium sp. CECT 9465 TaxID=2829794 RepID=UPI001E4692A1|nr:hypothetical protein [Novosphingobium sp. CECT 9465]CAH0495990.1 hypothetical protein NVSP9465_01015 [Novosphingobium sp. CECT 9465]